MSPERCLLPTGVVPGACRRAVTISKIATAWLGLGLLLWSVTVSAQPTHTPTPPSDELRELKNDLDAIRKELQEIKTILRQSPRALPAPTGQNVILRVADERVMGDRTAKVTIVEFSDFECPYCGRFARETFQQLERDYIKTGKVRYVFRNYPLAVLHKDAFRAAEAAGCAQGQGKFWEMHRRLFEHQNALGETELTEHAKAVGLNVDAFRQCLDGGKQAFEVRKDVAEAVQARVRGTPTFFLGLTDAQSQDMKAVDVILGAQPYLAFKMAIENLLDISK